MPFLMLCALLTGGLSAHAATRTVTSLADDGSAGTLRSQIAAATAGDTIDFGVTGTITLNGNEIGISKNLTISGPATGAGVTISGADANNTGSRIFTVSGGTFALSNLALTGGKGSAGNVGNGTGGAISIAGGAGVTLGNCSVFGNFAGLGGAINNSNGGTLSISNTRFSGNTGAENGGAINNNGTLSISDSTFSGNTQTNGSFPYGGGAITNAGTLNVSNSTFSGNSSARSGGAINNAGTLNISNSTFSGNRSQSFGDGGAISNQGALTVRNSTLVGNITAGYGGGINMVVSDIKNTLNLSNSIVAGNSAFGGPEIRGAVTSGDYNLVQNPSGATLSGAHNITGQSAGLDTLKSNGGPTQTFALLERSFAINAGDPGFDTGATPNDQRGAGYARKKSAAIDIGAFESGFTAGALLARDRSFIANPNVAFSGQLTVSGGEAGGTRTYSIVSGTLPDGLALNAATGLISGTPTGFVNSTFTYKVTDNNGFDSNTATVTISVTEPPSLVVTVLGDTSTPTDNLTSLREAVTYANSGNAGANPNVTFGVTGVIELNQPSLAIARDLTITGPGANNLTISGNGTNGAGQGNFSDSASIFRISRGTVGISGLTISDGTGDERLGGGIRMDGGTATLSNLVFASNYGQSGGGVYLSGGSMALDGCTFSNNVGPAQGGAIAIVGGTMTLTNSTLSDNNNNFQSAADGGAIYLSGGSLSINRTSISGSTGELGGGIHQVDGTLNIANSTISGNSARSVYINADSSIYGWGGGLFIGSGTVSISNSTIANNMANGNQGTARPGGGGIWNQGTLTLTNSTIVGNYTRALGGGIHMASAQTTNIANISNSIIAGNSAYLQPENSDLDGGAVGDYNLIQRIGNPALFFSSGTHNIYGKDPLLGPLANNGGPTQTYRLLSGSPVAEAGDPNFNAANLPFDQRGAGFPRVKNGRLDIGAYEAERSETELGQSGNSFVVNSLADHDDGICGLTDCTLREAVNYVPAGGTITFSVTGTITLTGGELRILRDVSIQGPANSPGITISGNNQSRIFGVGPQRNADNSLASTATPSRVNFSNLTLRDGNGVGTPGNGNLSGNGGAIFVDAAPTVNSFIQTTVANCTFVSNRATGDSSNGGAIRSPGVLTITNSTFFDNSATGNGGAIRSAGTLTVSNSTFNGNKGLVGGGIIYAGSAFTLNNSIVAGNSAPTGPDISGNVSAANYNFVGNGEGNTGPAVTPATTPATFKPTPLVNGTNGNQVGNSAATLNPRLGALANNGGPTQTMALLSGSPALNAGDPAFNGSGQFDQRGAGFPRVIGGRLDIGALESNLSPVLSIGDASVLEGNTGTGTPESGTKYLSFPLTLSAASSSAVTVTYSTGSGTATGGTAVGSPAGADYLSATNATATIPAGQTTGTISIAVLGDTVNEPNETLTVTLSGASGANLGTSSALGTIQNDDNAPTLSLEDGSAKGSAGSMEFTLSLSNPSSTSLSVAFATSDGTAIAGTNYSAQSGTLTFTAGQTTKSITITGLTQTTSDKKFQVTLSSPSGATLSRAVAMGTILAEAGSGSAATASGATVTLSGLRRNRATGRFVQPILVQNSTGADIAGPLYLVLDNLAPGLSLYGPNINGYTTNTLPTGSPYFTLPGLNRGTSQLIEIEFVNPSNGPVSFQTRVLKGPGTP